MIHRDHKLGLLKSGVSSVFSDSAPLRPLLCPLQCTKQHARTPSFRTDRTHLDMARVRFLRDVLDGNFPDRVEQDSLMKLEGFRPPASLKQTFDTTKTITHLQLLQPAQDKVLPVSPFRFVT